MIRYTDDVVIKVTAEHYIIMVDEHKLNEKGENVYIPVYSAPNFAEALSNAYKLSVRLALSKGEHFIDDVINSIAHSYRHYLKQQLIYEKQDNLQMNINEMIVTLEDAAINMLELVPPTEKMAKACKNVYSVILALECLNEADYDSVHDLVKEMKEQQNENRKDITNPLELLECIIAFDSRNWADDISDRMIYAIVFGWYDECYEIFGWDKDTIAEYKKMHERFEELKQVKFEETVKK